MPVPHSPTPSAAEALETLAATRGLVSWLTWEAIEGPDPATVVLRGARLRLPGGPAELRARRARLAGVDAEALAAGSLLAVREADLEGVDLRALFPGSAPFPAEHLPAEAALGLRLARPAAEDAVQALALRFESPGALRLDLRLDLAGPFEQAAPLRLQAAYLEAADLGLLPKLRAELARAAGSLDQAKAALRVMLAATLFAPAGPRSPLAQPLLRLLDELFDAAERRPIARIEARSETPLEAGAFTAALRGEGTAHLAVQADLAPVAPG